MSKIPSENINELDFVVLRQNLIDYVKNNSEFKDYDFDSSGLNFLVDLLTYNTQYSAYYLNQVASEMFLDTAQQRKNVVSIAKQMGYLANSKIAPKAIINLRLTNTGNLNTVLNVRTGTEFVGSKADGTILPFVSRDTVSLNRGNQYSSNIDLIQGSYVTENIVVNNLLLEKKFEISSADIDLNYLDVYVRQNAQDIARIKYYRIYDITLLDSESEVYYIEQNYNGKYQIIFGDGVIGKDIKNNNIIEISYLVTSGEEGNDCVNFDIVNKNLFAFTSLIQTVQFSSQGVEEENVDTIRNNARKLFFSQNRTVTEKDYQIILMKYFPFIDTLSVWGGEKNSPPLYGSVFCAVKPKNRFILTEAEKEQIRLQLENLNVITVLPKIIDPEYTYIKVDVRVAYDALQITLNEVEIVELVENAVFDYSKNNLLKFFSSFQITSMTKTIDQLNDYFMGAYIDLKLYQKRNVETGTGNFYEINFNNNVVKGTLVSTNFDYFDKNKNLITNCYLKESPDYTKLSINFKRVEAGLIKEYTLIDNIGSINYEDGVIKLEDFMPEFIRSSTSEMIFEMKTNSYVITPTKEQILTITVDDINVTPAPFVDRSSTTSNIAKANLFDS